MPRPLRRFIFNQVNEITIRTVGSRWSLVPTPRLRLEWIGIMAEACIRWPTVSLHDFQIMSSHATYHLSSGHANAVASWMGFVNAGTARAVQFHHGVRGRIWSRRYRAIPILDDASQRERSKYLMAQACAADAVIAPRHWPGAHAADALCRGADLEGSYVTAQQRRAALRDGGVLPLNRPLKLVPLPCLPDDQEKRRTWYRKIEQEIVEETRARHRAEGITCGPPEALCFKDPRYAPEVEDCSPAPACHATGGAAREGYRAVYAQFVDAWRLALDELKRCVSVCFPPGGWWPYGCEAVAARLQV